MRGVSADFGFKLPGSLDLSERGPKDERDYYTSTTLVDHYLPEIECGLGWEEPDEDEAAAWGAERRFCLQLNAYHVENEETGRAFHTHFRVAMNREEAGLLRDALGFFFGLEG